MNIVRTIPDIRTLNMPASKAFYEDMLGFKVAMEHAGMVILASTTQPKRNTCYDRRASGCATSTAEVEDSSFSEEKEAKRLLFIWIRAGVDRYASYQ